MDNRQHWQQVFNNKEPMQMSWTQGDDDQSLKALQALNLPIKSHIVEAGCGISTLSDQLLRDGYQQLTLLDISEQALIKQRKRHVEQNLYTPQIQYLSMDLGEQYNESDSDNIAVANCWLDRAVFHFLTEFEQQRNYLNRLLALLPKNGYWIVATFSEHGPDKCSGLPVMRYSQQGLVTFIEQHFANQFICLKQWQQQHQTPWGAEQSFNWWILQRI